ncbi:MAG TPA: EAL domain-containing protein [Asticcacaulis sp.]|nr:EAL domain-containing protein [Asticcacaulis sp.]
MVFKRLSTRLSVLYGALFAFGLLMTALTGYFSVVNNARQTAQSELQASARVFQRVWSDRTEVQSAGALLLAHDTDFRQAMLDQDAATVSEDFAILQKRIKADMGFVIGADGQPVQGRGDPVAMAVAAALQDARVGKVQTGVITVASRPYQVVAMPVLKTYGGPDRLGWVVFVSQLDAVEMQTLQTLASAPATASILTQTRGGLWMDGSGQGNVYAVDALSFFVDNSLRTGAAGPLSARGGQAIAFATRLQTLGADQKSVLLLSYPLKAALRDYQPVISALALIGALGLVFIILASLYLSRSLSRPIQDLTKAARALREGGAGQIDIVARYEMGELAEAFNDMAASMQAREQDITRLAKCDPATGLPNRSAFEDHLRALHDSDAAEQGGVAIVCIGVDRYTHIRAVWGVAYGHSLMTRLQEILGGIFAKAYIARLSGDTLGLCLTPCAAAQAMPLARAIAARLDKRIRVTEDQSLDVRVSLGVYHVGKTRGATDDCVERALIALDQARAAKVKVASFDPRVYSELADTLLLTDQLHAALQNRDMMVYYQPKFSYREGRITSVEALVRWSHAERGFVSPQRFVAIAEETGAIRDLTLQVLQTCIDDQKRLKAAGFDLDVSINYSGRLLSDDAFNQRTLRLCQQAVGRICLEITETAVIDDPKIGLAAINTFVDAGLEISIDDFGTGLSSLAYLKQIPAHELKIDRAFVMEIESGQRDALVVRSSIDLAHGLGMKVTAEGVETRAAFTLLQAMGCDLAQGYGIARPMPYDALGPFLTDFNGVVGGADASPNGQRFASR